jgi:putative spermidine/putrescine transport system ATP-binding protein
MTTAAGPPVVVLEGVSKTYGSVRALDRLDLGLRDGELLSLLGPSGCGKTTSLNVIAGFVVPDAGRVLIDGADVTARAPWQRGLGVVFQSYALFPHLSVGDNVAFGLRERGVARGEAARRVAEALALVRLPGAETRRPGELSGGMQQRVALARALVIRPRVLLLDEPLAALDKKLRDEMRVELKDIQRRVGITTLFVTHDQQEALGLSDRVGVMRAGRLEQLGTPREIYERPATAFVADFVGASTLIEGTLVSRDTLEVAPGVRLPVALPRPAAPGTRARLLIRPEHVEIAPAPGAGTALAATVTSVTYLGDRLDVRVEVAPGVIVRAQAPSGLGLQAGDRTTVRLPPGAFLEVS